MPLAVHAQPPTVASINLCTDQLVVRLADPSQILTLSWLSADPEESMVAEAARGYPLNYGSAEELLAIGADVVIAGTETSPFTRSLLRRLGATVVEIAPAASIADIARNLERVGEAIEREDEASRAIAAMRSHARAIRARRPGLPRSAIVVRPGGFTVGPETLAHELIGLAGLDNRIAGLDRWGSLSIETLLTIDPEIVVFTSYRSSEASLHESFLSHPALAALAESALGVEVPARYFACGAPESLTSAEMLLEQMAAN